MKRLLYSLVVPAVAVLSLAGSAVIDAPANAAVHSHDAMTAKTWHGKVEKLNAAMGTTESFTVAVGMKDYTVHYDAMTHWTMGSKKDLKVGALVTVTGTLSGTTISATKLSA